MRWCDPRLCGDRIPFFENFAGRFAYTVDYQVVVTRDAEGNEPQVSRDYRDRDWDPIR